MRVELVRTDPDVAGFLGDVVLAELASMIDDGIGECDVCHRPLGQVPVSLTVHAPERPGSDSDSDSDSVLVLPAHAACRASKLDRYQPGYAPFGPANTYAINAFVLQVTVVQPGRPGQPDGPGQERSIAAVLVNPSVDVQSGRMVDGHWRSLWELQPARDGLVAITDAAPVPPGPAAWGARLSTDPTAAALPTERGSTLPSGPVLTVTGPGVSLRVHVADDFQAVLEGAGSCLVFMSDTVHATEIVRDGTVIGVGVDMADLGRARKAGRLFGVWAQLGAEPVAQPLPYPDRAAQAGLTPGPGGRIPATTEEMQEVLGDVEVEVRAAFSDHPAIGLDRIASGNPDGTITPVRMPVLLLEPRRAMMLDHTAADAPVREAHAEIAIADGLTRALPNSTSLLNTARDWQLRTPPSTRTGGTHSGTVELVTPAGNVLASGMLRYPPGWADAARSIGHVLVIYGVRVGVRPPAGQSYNDRDRRAELDDSRQVGAAAWGIVAWNPG